MSIVFRGGVAALAACVVLTWSRPVEACGCFAPPNAAEPIVQAGERILFAVDNGKVIAHIQIQYAGEAKDFGWLLPLPSVPTLKLGSDDLFTLLGSTTQPTYELESRGSSCAQPATGGFVFGCAAPLARGNFDSAQTLDAGVSPLVTQSSVGPYEYAVLRADDKTAMLQWLADNRYFVPAGTDAAVGPYINPGAYFLALKLKAGARTGDVTPVVLEYASSLPMIPLILTSVGATPNMGVQVWLVGNGRGIPRNFHHVVVNDAQLDWLGGATNYANLVTRAVAEAPKKHAFVTEYAGPSTVMKDQLTPPGRFGTEADLASAQSPGAFIGALLANGFEDRRVTARTALPPAIVRLVLGQVPYPATFAAKGIDVDTFLRDLDYYLGAWRTQHPEDFVGYTSSFDAATLAQQVFAEYVTPLREANALFTRFPTLTRLFTTLSPEDMTDDPVFSFNPSLPDVPRAHKGTTVVTCSGNAVTTEQGWVVDPASLPITTPAARRVEILAEEGQATIVTDNAEAIRAAVSNVNDPTPAEMPKTGCAVVDPMSLGLVALMASLRRRTRRA